MPIAHSHPKMCARAIMNEKARARITAQQVADLAGVSRSAVSRCFNGGGRVSKDKRDRIFAAAADLGYRPNAIARSLTGQPTDLVALVTTEILSYQSNDQVRQVTLCLAEAGKRDRAVDESGNQIGVFGRIGSGPLTKEDIDALLKYQNRMFTVRDDGTVIFQN